MGELSFRSIGPRARNTDGEFAGSVLEPSLHAALGSFVERLNVSRTRADLTALMAEATSSLGADSALYCTQGNPTLGQGPRQLVLSTYPLPWEERFRSAGYAHGNHLREALRIARSHIVWSEVTARTRLTERQRQMMDEARGFGLRDAVAVRLRSPRDGFSFLSLTTEDGRGDTIASMVHHLDFIRAIGTLFHARITSLIESGDLADSAPAPRLSRRQLEVLQWAARGKTDWETGTILGITEKAVKFHAAAARGKLDAANRTHAVAKALSLGLIQAV